MRKLGLISILGLLTVSCAEQSAQAPQAADITITNVSVFDGEAVHENRTVEIVDGKIFAVRNAEGETAARTIIDGSGHTLLPGLINAHVHMQSSDDPEAGLSAMLRMGVTSVRDLAGDVRPLQALKQRKQEEALAIPDIYFSALIAGPKLMSDPRNIAAAQGFEPGTAPWMRAVTDESDLVSVIAAAKATGATGLKLYASMEAGLLNRVTEEGRRQGMQIWTHSVIFPANASDVIASGPTQIIHMKGLVSASDENLPDNFGDGVRQYMAARPYAALDPNAPPYSDLLADIKARGILVEPALVADGDFAMLQGRDVPPPMLAMRDWACAATGAAYRAGVTLGAGTDFHGEGDLFFLELTRLHECGLPREAVLTAATMNNARAIGVEDRKGRIAPGYDADLLLVEGDPTRDLAALKNVARIIKDGVLIE